MSSTSINFLSYQIQKVPGAYSQHNWDHRMWWGGAREVEPFPLPILVRFTNAATFEGIDVDNTILWPASRLSANMDRLGSS